MNISTWLQQSINTFENAGVTTARLDALVLLADELGCDKAWILAHQEHELQIEELKNLSTKVIQRTYHTPLAYLRGHIEFYGREFKVDQHVLVPRPETEDIIESLKVSTADTHNPIIIDVGTGSGCLAITASLEVIPSTVIAMDNDPLALTVARANSHSLGSDIHFFEGDLLDPLKGYDLRNPIIIIANLPYVPYDYAINEAAKHEPKNAIFSENGGLKHYERLFEQAQNMCSVADVIITESLETQHSTLAKIAESYGYIFSFANGLAQTFVRRP